MNKGIIYTRNPNIIKISYFNKRAIVLIKDTTSDKFRKFGEQFYLI